MNWYEKIAERSGFKFNSLETQLWEDLLSKEKDRENIQFSTENNNPKDDPKYIELEEEVKIGHSKRKFRIYAQLMAAGGDWENPVYYFKCQSEYKTLLDEDRGWGHNWSDDYVFIYIPSKKDGNLNLIKGDKGFKASEEKKDFRKLESVDIKKLWDSLKKHALIRLKEVEQELSKEYDPDTLSIEKKYNIYKHTHLNKIFKE